MGNTNDSKLLTGRQRTLDFIIGKEVDRPPFHPIIMRWAAKYADVKYRNFCQDYHSKCYAMIKCAEDFEIDWVTVMSDPYAEASAYGILIEYPENDLPLDRSHFMSVEDLLSLKVFDAKTHQRTASRLAEIREFRRITKDKYFVVGWVEGPVAEYADLRGVSEAAVDLLVDLENVAKVMDVITDAAINFITLQIEAGADCIGIGDAFCSQIGPDIYRELAFEREKRMVEHIHNLGALAKLHICGNTSAILPDMIATGADIIDVDHLVPSFAPFVSLLTPHQVFSGKVDPVSIIQDGKKEQIEKIVREGFHEAEKRCIISAGCEITPDTTIENMKIFRNTIETDFNSI